MRVNWTTGLLVTFSSALVAFGCSGDKQTTIVDNSGNGTTTGGETTGGTTTGGETTGGTGGNTGGTTGIEKPDPADEKVCEDASKAPDPYVGYAFTGLTHTPQTPKSNGITYNFSCTKCPGGTLGITGKYKYFEEDDVATPDPAQWKETWEFDGNYFVNIIEGIDTDGKMKQVRAEGFYFCPDGSELGDIKYKDYWNVVLVYLTAVPAGPFGIEPGAVDLSFLGVDAGQGAISIYAELNLYWDPAGTSQGQNQYCRIGSDYLGRPCEDPFAQ